MVYCQEFPEGFSRAGSDSRGERCVCLFTTSRNAEEELSDISAELCEAFDQSTAAGIEESRSYVMTWPPEELDTQVSDKQHGVGSQLVTSLLLVRRGLFANHALQRL